MRSFADVLNGSTDRRKLIERARKYVATIPPAVEGDNGSKPTYHVAALLLEGFALDREEARAILTEYSERCLPPWSENEIEHKLDGASKNLDPAQLGRLANAPPPSNGKLHSNGAIVRGQGYVIEDGPPLSEVLRATEDNHATDEPPQPPETEAAGQDADVEPPPAAETPDHKDDEAPPKKARKKKTANVADLQRQTEEDGPDQEKRFHRTELGNAKRFARDHGKNVRYCHPWSKWLVWDFKRWKLDDTAAVVRLAKLTLKNMLDKCGRRLAALQNATDLSDSQRQAIAKDVQETIKWVLKSEGCERHFRHAEAGGEPARYPDPAGRPRPRPDETQLRQRNPRPENRQTAWTQSRGHAVQVVPNALLP